MSNDGNAIRMGQCRSGGRFGASRGVSPLPLQRRGSAVMMAGMDEMMLPSENPDLAGVWSQLSETERLQLQLMDEPVPEALDDAVRRMFPGRP